MNTPDYVGAFSGESTINGIVAAVIVSGWQNGVFA